MTRGQLLRRLPLLLVLAVLAWLLLGDQPRERTLIYALPADPAPTHVDVRIRDEGGGVPAAIAWGTETTPARDRQPHRARLAPGAYQLEATLRFPDGSARALARQLSIERDDEQIVVHLR